MPVIVNRRKHGLSIALSDGKYVTLAAGGQTKVSSKDLSSYGVMKAKAAKDIAIIAEGAPRTSSVKTEQTDHQETTLPSETGFSSGNSEKSEKSKKRKEDSKD